MTDDELSPPLRAGIAFVLGLVLVGAFVIASPDAVSLPVVVVVAIAVGLLSNWFIGVIGSLAGVPLGAAVLGIAVAVIVQPDPPPLAGGDFGDFFGTGAQVLAGLLIALVLEDRQNQPADPKARRLELAALVTLVIALLAAVAGLLPAVGNRVQVGAVWLVAGGMSCGAATLIALAAARLRP
jgi:hypothetical protein